MVLGRTESIVVALEVLGLSDKLKAWVEIDVCCPGEVGLF